MSSSIFESPLTRRGTIALWDAVCWASATAVVLGVRLDFEITEDHWRSILRYLAVVITLALAIGFVTKFYRGRFRVGSFDEAVGLAGQFAITGALAALTFTLLDSGIPRSIPVLVPPIALVLAATGRWTYRAIRDRSGLEGVEDTRTLRAVMYGAGDAGNQLLGALRTDRTTRYKVVALVDDNPGKRHLRLYGIPVLGTGNQLAEVASDVEADVVILAVSNASGEFIGKLQDKALDIGLQLLIVPAISELIGGRVGSSDIRKVEIGDVLGRHPVVTDIGNIADYLMGRRILITGAGGSIGAELARQVHRFGPASLALLDRDESALHGVQLSIHGHGMLDSDETVLNDIRDRESLEAVFAKHRPEIVFHAAALKHLPMLERFPDEGWKTNVLGTENVLALSEKYDVKRFVNISTDKAADSTSVLGSTKRIAEQLTSWYAAKTGLPYISVRFGNVLGSRGSMLLTFNSQIESGGPVTVTHPEVTRYFMTIPEACELVVQAGAIGTGGEVLVLDMGSPVKILDVARRMIAQSGKHVPIVYTGLRPGEKLHEVLFAGTEESLETAHPMIRSVVVAALDPAELEWREAPGSART